MDTNIVSEFMKLRPDGRIRRWYESVKDQKLYLSVITVGEIRKGIETAADGRRKENLDTWLRIEIPRMVDDHFLPVTRAIAARWGRLLAHLPPDAPAVDALLAATAIEHNLHLVTRNKKHFHFPGLLVVDPWDTN